MYKMKWFMSVIIPLLTLCLSYESVHADDNSLNFSLTTVQPENQINKEATYFDILVEPSQTQQLQLKVSNLGEKKQTIRIAPTNAITNSSGFVDYSEKKNDYKYDDNLKIKFTSLVSDAQEIEIEPRNTATVTFDFVAPKESFEGIILGGFVASSIDDEEEKKNNSTVSFINKFQVIKAVEIRSSGAKKTDIDPVFKLNDVKPTLYTYRTAVSANIQNTTPVLLKNVEIKADISKRGLTKVLKSEVRKDVEMAPYSNYDFPVMWGNEPLKAGDYTIKISVTANNKETKFNKDFSISKEQSYNINEKAVDLEEENSSNKWIWIIVFFILLLIIFALVTYIFLKQKKSRRIQKNHKRGRSKKNLRYSKK